MNDKKDKTNSTQKAGVRKNKTMGVKKDKLHSKESATRAPLAGGIVAKPLSVDFGALPVASVGGTAATLESGGTIFLGETLGELTWVGATDNADKWYLSGSLGIGTADTKGGALALFKESYGNLSFFSKAGDIEYDGGVDKIFTFNNVSGGPTGFLGGNVGIGTVDVKRTLQVEGNEIHSGGPGGGFSFGNRGSSFVEIPSNGERWVWYSHESKARLWSGTDKLCITSDGNVGIGTAEPTHPLHVKTNWGFLALDSNTAGQDSGLRLMEGGAVKWHIWNSANDAKFYIARDGLPPIFAIDKIGNLSVSNDIAIGGKHAFRGNDSWLRLNQDGAFPNGVHTPGMMCPNSLNVGGRESWSTNPGSGNGWFAGSITYDGQLNKLDVAESGGIANIRAHDLLFGHSSRRGEMGRALVDLIRDITVPTYIDAASGEQQYLTRTMNTLVINYDRDWQAVVIDGIVQTPSSRQLKENIYMLSSQVAKNIISTLEPVRFTYKQDTLKLECLGFIAEDAPPEVTLPTKDTITFNHIVAALTRVVKDQEQSISELKTQVSLLIKQNTQFNR